MGCGSTNIGSQQRALQQQQQAATNQSVGQINQAFAGFNPAFYQGVQNAYTNYATPQLYQQYQPIAQQTNYKLANQGLTGSSSDRYLHQQLGQTFGNAQQQIGNQGLQQSQQLQQQVGNERSGLVSQALSASNPSSIAGQAQGAAGQFQGPSAFAPLGQLFNNFASMYLGNTNQNTYNQFANQYLNQYNNPGFGTGGAIPQPTY